MKPMLAVQCDVSELLYPLYASPKLDGIRGVVYGGKLLSRSLKPIPNPFVSKRFSFKQIEGLDGELILGSPTAPDVYRVTNGACARHEGTPDVTFYAFDLHDRPKLVYEDRMEALKQVAAKHACVKILEHVRIENEKELLKYETQCLKQGYEGLILRHCNGPYKYGRSTVNEGWMLKLKRFVDSEAKIISVYEEMENTNEKTTNELGRGQRSSHMAGLVPKGRAGGLEVEDVNTGVRFRMGTGLDDQDREYFWDNRTAVPGKLVKYKSFPVGVKDLPRHPVYLGGREAWDL